MANRERGEVEVLVEGRAYTWRLSLNGLCALEARTGQKFGDVLRDLDTLSLRALRDVVWQALQEYHATEFPTVESAGDFIDRLGGMFVAVVKVRELFEVNQPREPARPPMPAGTGEGSKLRVAASA